MIHPVFQIPFPGLDDLKITLGIVSIKVPVFIG